MAEKPFAPVYNLHLHCLIECLNVKSFYHFVSVSVRADADLLLLYIIYLIFLLIFYIYDFIYCIYKFINLFILIFSGNLGDLDCCLCNLMILPGIVDLRSLVFHSS